MTRRHAIVRWGILLFALCGAYAVKDLHSAPAIKWMDIWYPSDLHGISAADAIAFILSLKVPIPPMLAGLEIFSDWLTGTPDIVTIWLYRASLVGAYVLALVLARGSLARWGMALVASGVFLYATTVIHPGNPQGYDIFFPVVFLLYVCCLQKAADMGGAVAGMGGPRLRVMPWAVAAGLCLALTEWMRPFVIYMLPLLLWMSYLMIRQRHAGWAVWGAFALPVVLMCGAWHAHLWSAHRQLTMSNHVGFNLQRAWPQAPMPPLVDEVHNAPLKPGRWPNLNTVEHQHNSETLKKAVLTYWRQHPGASLKALWRHMRVFVNGPTDIYGHKPTSRVFGIYKVMTRWLSLIVGLKAIVVLWRVVAKRGRHLAEPLDAGDIIGVFFLLCLLFLCAGEMGEEARFLISLTPMLACMPFMRSPQGHAP
ncbi:MAG: hypothetical protein QM749_19430 [Aquabacterium sp.]